MVFVKFSLKVSALTHLAFMRLVSDNHSMNTKKPLKSATFLFTTLVLISACDPEVKSSKLMTASETAAYNSYLAGITPTPTPTPVPSATPATSASPTPTATPTPTPTPTPVPSPTPYSVGDHALGGVIAYILQPGDPGYDASTQHGFVATLADEGTAPGGCYMSTLGGAWGTALGTGAQNTADLVAMCGEVGSAAMIAAGLNEGGYHDWYLPSQAEMEKLYLNQAQIGGFSMSVLEYWTSTQSGYLSFLFSMYQNIWTGYSDRQGYSYKNQNFSVRPIRSF